MSPPTHPKTTSTTSESVWASLLNKREDLGPRVETPNQEEAQARFAGEDEEGEEKEKKGKEKKGTEQKKYTYVTGQSF